MPNSPRKFFLAIRHKPSGGFLPAVKGYGFTRTEPSLSEAPRLFTKTGAAKQALTRWLEGELFEGTASEDDGIQNLRLVRRPERQASDMEIVEAELLFRTLSDAQLRIL